MTIATAKPTPGPSPVWTAETYFVCLRSGEMGWCVKDADDTVCDVYTDDPGRIAELIAEAGTVFSECGMTPRQLLNRVRELESTP